LKIVHISSSKRFNNDGSPNNAGGVEKFAHYLQQATGCVLAIPGEVNIRDYDIVIGDGYHVSSANYNAQKVISVCHGSWLEFAKRNNKMSDFIGEAQKQHEVWINPKIKKVAVSEASAKYLKIHDGVEADKIILNSVDVNLFKPVEHKNEKPVIIFASSDYNKDGHGRLHQVHMLLKDEFEFRYLNARIGEEQDKFAQGDLYIQGSFYEGNSYATIEAMSCGLPIIASCTGLFEETKFNPSVGEVVAWNAPAEEYAKAIKYVWSKKNTYDPRGWVKNNASFEIFKKQWEDYIKSI
jgi:hypothetical protein